MKPIAVFLIACTGLALHAAPARLPYEPDRLPDPPPSQLDLRGTYWFGKCYTDNFWIIFEKDGSLSYGYNQNKFHNGTWKVEGNNLYFEMNGKYLEFRGAVQGSIIQGEAWNIAGGRWQTFFRLEPTKK